MKLTEDMRQLSKELTDSESLVSDKSAQASELQRQLEAKTNDVRKLQSELEAGRLECEDRENDWDQVWDSFDYFMEDMGRTI